MVPDVSGQGTDFRKTSDIKDTHETVIRYRENSEAINKLLKHAKIALRYMDFDQHTTVKCATTSENDSPFGFDANRNQFYLGRKGKEMLYIPLSDKIEYLLLGEHAKCSDVIRNPSQYKWKQLF